MQQLAGVIVERLRRTWFGSVLALLWLALVTIVPTVRQCFGIAAKRGEVGGIVCSWGPALESLRQPGLALLLVFVGAIALSHCSSVIPRRSSPPGSRAPSLSSGSSPSAASILISISRS